MNSPGEGSVSRERDGERALYTLERERERERDLSPSARDSTHYRMYAPHAIFDVAVGRVQMKLLLPRGVDLASRVTLPAGCQNVNPLSLSHAFNLSLPANVIITFNECYSPLFRSK